MASLAELTDNPFVQNTIDSVALRDATDLPKTRIIVRPQNTPDNEPVKQDDSKLQNIIDHLFGLNGKERYQLWPERLIRDAISAPHDSMTEGLPMPGLRREDITDIPAPTEPTKDSTWLGKALGVAPVAFQPNDLAIEKAQAMSALAGSGGLAGAGSEAGVALGSAPFLRPALKYGEKLYKGKPGQQHMDVIPADLYPTFQKQAMSGEDISNFNFGFLNHKGQFLSREDALKYAIDNGLVDPHSAQYGALTSTLMSDTAKPGAALAAVANTNKIHPELEATLVKAYNNRLPSYEDQYYKWAGKDSDYQILNKKTAEDIYGDPSDWPKEINDAFKKSDEIVAISDGNNFEVLPKTEAKTYQQHIKDTVESQNGLHHATDLDDIMNGLKTQTEGAEGAASDAFKELAKSQGWEVGNGHRYFDIRRGDDVKHVRISDHPNLTKSNPNAIIPDINIAPGAHDFHDAFKMLKSDNEAGIGVGVLAQTNKPFYSAVENAVAAAKQPKADAQQWISFLKNQPGVKQEELAHLGLDKLQGSISKDDLLKAVQEGQPQIKEVVKGGVTNKEDVIPDQIAQNQYKEAWDAYTKELNRISDNGTNLTAMRSNEYRNLQSEMDGIHDLMVRDTIDRMGGLSTPTKYHSYQLPGGENYREMLLTLPDKFKDDVDGSLTSMKMFGKPMNELTQPQRAEVVKFMNTESPKYKSSHWDEPNVLAHIRMNDRTIDGKKTLHLEEIQSDWHQAGRKSGYESDFKIPDRTALRKQMDEIRALAPPDLDTMGKMQWLESQPKYVELRNEFNRQVPSGMSEAVPDAPFKKTWDELALKKAITEAVKNGYDQISWTPGEAQAARYDLSKQLKELQYLKNDDGTYEIAGIKSNGDGFNHPDNVTADKLPDIVGKEMAEKIIKNEGKRARGHPSNGGYFDGIDLKVGGQGMKAFYDKMLVDKMNKLISKYDSKVKMVDHGQMKIPAVVITPKLKEKVLKEGFPLFSAGVPVFTPIDYNPFESK